jgi:hypothetical protein
MHRISEGTSQGQRPRRQRTRGMVALGATLSLVLVGCGADDALTEDEPDAAATVSEDGLAETGDAEDPVTEAGDDADPAEDGAGSSEGADASGTLSFDGGDITLERLECLQVPAEGNTWRIVGTFDGNDGWVQFDAPSFAFIEFSGGAESWSTEADAPLTVSSDGASGDVTMLLDGAASDPDQPEARLIVDITC